MTPRRRPAIVARHALAAARSLRRGIRWPRQLRENGRITSQPRPLTAHVTGQYSALIFCFGRLRAIVTRSLWRRMVGNAGASAAMNLARSFSASRISLAAWAGSARNKRSSAAAIRPAARPVARSSSVAACSFPRRSPRTRTPFADASRSAPSKWHAASRNSMARWMPSIATFVPAVTLATSSTAATNRFQRSV